MSTSLYIACSALFIMCLCVKPADASRKECGATHTDVKAGPWLMQPATFGGRVLSAQGQSVCKVLNNAAYKKMFPYDGRVWNIEHIVELSHSETALAHCNKNIWGNVILADATWNKKVGNLCWTYGKIEKQQVYGPIFHEAMENVRMCCMMDDSEWKTNMIIIGSIIGGIILGAVALLVAYARRIVVTSNMVNDPFDEFSEDL